MTVAVQVTLIVYMTLFLGNQINIKYKMGFGWEDSPPSLGKTIRDTAPILFLLPAGWAIWALRRWKRNGTDLFESIWMFGTGFLLTGFLLALAFVATMSIWARHSLIQTMP